MYIICPSCKTTFVVTPQQVGPLGRKVKCSKCFKIWHAKLNINLNTNLSNTTISRPLVSSKLEKGSNLPAVIPVKIPIYLYIFPIILAFLIIFINTVFFYDYAFAALKVNPNLSIRDVSLENHLSQKRVIVHYKIFNKSQKVAVMPLIRVRLIDKNDKVIKSYTLDNKIMLETQRHISIKTEFNSVPYTVNRFDITLGNKLDFMLY